MLDTKNFYGGSLHVSYAPEFESLSQTRQKIMQRQRDIIFRLNNLQKERDEEKIKARQENDANKLALITETTNKSVDIKIDNTTLNMGQFNTITDSKDIKDTYKGKGKRKIVNTAVIEKRFKPCFVNEKHEEIGESSNRNDDNSLQRVTKVNFSKNNDKDIEVINFTSAYKETISNIDEALNYNKFGNEVIKKIECKPLNKIKYNFNINK